MDVYLLNLFIDEVTEKLEKTTSQETQEITQQTETDRPQSSK